MIDDTFDSELPGEQSQRPSHGLPGNDHPGFRRRAILKALAALGAGTATFRRALAAQSAAAGKVTPEMIKQAEWIAGLELTDKERESAANEVQESLGSFQKLRKVNVGYDIAPALAFVPAPGLRPAQEAGRNRARPSGSPELQRPDSDEALAFLSVAELSALIRSRRLSSTELTKLYLGRLKRFDPLLKCVVTLTEELALESGGAGGRRDRGGQVSRPTPRHSLGRQGPDRLPGLSHDLGRPAVQGPDSQ